MGEGDVRALLYNVMGKARVGEDRALELFEEAARSGIVSCSSIGGGWRKDGLSPEDVVKCLIYDRPVFFVSMLAPPPDPVEIRRKIMLKKLKEKFANADSASIPAGLAEKFR